MKIVLALTALALLSACGADGEPVPPTRAKAAPSSGVSISGEARVGVVKTF
ncbi:argininosuccinate lyase [Pseudooceanicola sp.]|jgi:hypothetical protein|uniref:argininosuccinate lyase n=1 Tax=Pseudooceanicola sp. TaxID=1914328 RepID=UPI0040580A08